MTTASRAGCILSSQRKKTPHECARCGRPYLGLARSRYCSPKCAHAAYWAAHKDQINERRKKARGL